MYVICSGRWISLTILVSLIFVLLIFYGIDALPLEELSSRQLIFWNFLCRHFDAFISDSLTTGIVFASDGSASGNGRKDIKTSIFAGEINVQRNPIAVAVNNITNKIYVANYGDNTVSVINDKTNGLIENIRVGAPPTGIAVDPITDRIYVSKIDPSDISIVNGSLPLKKKNNVSVIDGKSSNTLAEIAVNGNPTGITVNPITSMVYVITSNAKSKTLTVINGSTNTIASEVKIANVMESLSNTMQSPTKPNPNGVAIDPVRNMVYILDYNTETVYVVNGTDNSVLASVKTSKYPEAIAIDPKDQKAYIANAGANKISVVNTTDFSILPSIIAGNFSSLDSEIPTGIAIDPIKNKIFVTKPRNDMVSVIDGSANNVEKTLRMGSHPTGLAVNPNNNMIYVTKFDSDKLSVIDGSLYNKTFSQREFGFKVKNNPISVDTNPLSNRIYVGHQSPPDTGISVIDTTTDTQVDTIFIENGASVVDFDPNTNLLYVVNKGGINNTITLYAIDGKTHEGVFEVPLGRIEFGPEFERTDASEYDYTSGSYLSQKPFDIAINPITNRIYVSSAIGVSEVDGNLRKLVSEKDVAGDVAVNPYLNTIYVSNSGNDTVATISGSTGEILKYIKVGRNPQGIEVNPETNIIYVANLNDDTISVIDGDTNEVRDTLAVPSNPFDITINPITNMIYVANMFSDVATVINGTTNNVTEVQVGSDSRSVAVDSKTNRVYITDFSSDTVSVIDGSKSKVIVGITYDVNPSNSGDIFCNDVIIPGNYTRYILDTYLKCEAKPNSGFAFSSWSGDFYSGNTAQNNLPSTTFRTSEYGKLTANFVTPIEVSIPIEALIGIIVSPIVGWTIPYLIEGYRESRQRKIVASVLRDIDVTFSRSYQNTDELASNIDQIKRNIDSRYSTGKIKPEHRDILMEKISAYEDEIEKS